MSIELISLVLIGSMIIFLAAGVEVFAGLAIPAAIGLLFLVGQSLDQFAFTAFVTMNSFVLTAVPLFIFMGSILSTTGVVRSLFDAVNKWAGVLPGGLVSSVIAVNGLFGAMCGATAAATATFGKIAFPEMERLGYSPELALGAIAAGGVLSAAIPPSCTLIVYGAWAETSVPRLFAGVLIPGIMLTLLFVLTVTVRVTLNPSLAPKRVKYTWREKLVAVRDLLPWIAIVVAVLGVIFGGVMTPTEAAAFGVVISIVLALGYRKMSLAALKESMFTTVRITSMVAFIIFTAVVLRQVFQHIGIVTLYTEFILSLPFGKYGILAMIALVYLIGGCFMSDWGLLLITLPFALPIITELGFSPTWFGVWFVMVGEVGLITPPYGLHLFILKAVVPKHDVMIVARGALPFIFPMLVVGVLITAFPQLVMWLPSMLR